MIQRITDVYVAHYSQPAVGERLVTLRRWVGAIASSATTRVASATLENFEVTGHVSAGEGLQISVEYEVHLINAQGSVEGGDLVEWGGWNRFSATAGMILSGSRWMVSTYTEVQMQTTNDPSAATGWSVSPKPTAQPTR